MLPIEIEPIEKCRQRLPQALQGVYSTDFCQRFPSETPGKKRRHAFDFEVEGMQYRAIVSIDELPTTGKVFHVSVSSGDNMPTLARAIQVAGELIRPGVLHLLGAGHTGCAAHLIFQIPEAP